MMCYEVIRARGHENIKATHKNTLEITKDSYLTPRGDCIIGIAADKSVYELNEVFKNCIKFEDAILIIILEVDSLKDIILAQGHPSLVLSNKRKLIIRRSSYIDTATLGIRANKAAVDIKRELVEKLKHPETELVVHLYVKRLHEIASINTGSRSIF